MRERFLAVVREEVGAMGQRITDLAAACHAAPQDPLAHGGHAGR